MTPNEKTFGLIFDEDVFKLIKKEQKLTSKQSVLDYLFDMYLVHRQADKIISEIDKLGQKRITNMMVDIVEELSILDAKMENNS